MPYTSTASISKEATSFEGVPMLFCAEMRLRRSEICCSVGARVIEARLSGSRLPGDSRGKLARNPDVEYEVLTASFQQQLNTAFGGNFIGVCFRNARFVGR